MKAANHIIERLRQCATLEEVDALAKKHAGDMLRMNRDPELLVRVIHIRNLAKQIRSKHK